MNDLNVLRKKASLKSKGQSSDLILKSILNTLKKNNLKNISSILDIGCGTGTLLKELNILYPNANLTGIDYTKFTDFDNKSIKFLTHDCNTNFPPNLGTFDLIISSEVIEHLENGRHFVRQISNLLNHKGYLLISTPNPESITSILSYIIRGYHSAFGPNDYPAHINSYTLYELSNIIRETNSFNQVSYEYIKNGRMPHLESLWKDFTPFFTGKRFSDNFLVFLKKN